MAMEFGFTNFNEGIAYEENKYIYKKNSMPFNVSFTASTWQL